MYAATYEPLDVDKPVPDNMNAVLGGAVIGELLYCIMCLVWVIVATNTQIRRQQRKLALDAVPLL
jgi:hypothetical protein